MSRSASSQHVYVVDDDRPFRLALVRGLQKAGYDVHQFDSPQAFLEQLPLFRPAVLVLDVQMPGLTGVELQTLLQRKNLDVPAIFVSGESTVAQGVTAMRQGAIDFLTKPFDFDQLLTLLDRGLKKDAQTRQATDLQNQRRQQLRQLKPREQEAFFCLAKGYSYAETMSVMQISLPTAKQYRTAVMRQLQLNSLSELIQFHRELTEP